MGLCGLGTLQAEANELVDRLPLVAVFFVSSTVTFLRIEPIEMYEHMGYSDAQLEALRQFQTINGTEMAVWIAALFVPYLAYLIYLKKYIRTESGS